jgi:hypothetical protein
VQNFVVTVGAVLSLVVLAACGGSSSDAPVTCGSGTHDNGTGTCALDPARSIENTTSNYWACSNNVGFLQFFSGGAGQFHYLTPPGVVAITWRQTTGTTDGLTFTASAANHTLSAIRPNAVSGPVSFTANYDTGYPTSCSLVNATMP